MLWSKEEELILDLSLEGKIRVMLGNGKSFNMKGTIDVWEKSVENNTQQVGRATKKDLKLFLYTMIIGMIILLQ